MESRLSIWKRTEKKRNEKKADIMNMDKNKSRFAQYLEEYSDKRLFFC
jgi:hypothetical protein